jgi:hypothetical protein
MNNARVGLLAVGMVAGVVGIQTALAVDATGGTVTKSGSYRIHTFTNGGTLTVSSPGTVEVLLVGGGGGGGCAIGGGGGGGGVVTIPAASITAGTYTVTVGQGGVGGNARYDNAGASGGNGTASTIFGATAAGGGGGGHYADVNGQSGGSGGGAGAAQSGTGTGGASSGSSLGGFSGTVYGNRGGNQTASRNGDPTSARGGGGAGAAAADENPSTTNGGNGGTGIANAILGTSYYWGGGGGGSAHTGFNGGNGGLGGGGGGSSYDHSGGSGGGSALNVGANAVGGDSQNGGAGGANTGGGGGGGTWRTSEPWGNSIGGAGGSGIVIVRYLFGPSWSGVGASNVTTTSASAYATLGTTNADVYLLWDTSDKGTTDLAAWGNTNFLGSNMATGTITGAIANLSDGSSRVFRFYGTNAALAADGWSAPGALITGELTVTSTVASVSEVGGGAGQFTVYRPAGLTNGDLVVNYAVGGTAVAGTDYQALSGTTTIPSGTNSVTIAVTPIDTLRSRGIRTVVLTLQSGAYWIGAADSDTVTITGLSNHYSLFKPVNYPVVATDLVIASGSIAIDTKDGTSAPTWAYGTTNYTGQIVTNRSGKVVLALFSFGNLAISNGVSFTVAGNLGLVLSCTGNLTMANTVNMNGATPLGGPGGEAGSRMVSYASAPPTANHGNGGINAIGYGYGAGAAGTFCSGGGGYGGLGGDGKYLTAETTGVGTNYGDGALADLFGGSGGGGSSDGTGGGGGGALELIANDTLAIAPTAILRLNGGGGAGGRTGGGGSGGGLILAADTLKVYGNLQVIGGAGNTLYGDRAGGGGGGGRIAFFANTLMTNGMNVSAAGGSVGLAGYGHDGGTGSFRYPGDGNLSGGDFSYPFVAAALPAGIFAIGTADVRTRSADLVGQVATLGGDPGTTVSCYWGTNSSAWDFSTNLGATGVGLVTNRTQGLSPNTTYAFTFSASNSSGVSWAPTTNGFSTLALWPTIANAGAGNITTNAATVYGTLSTTGESATVVFLFYGTTPGTWIGANALGPCGVGTVSGGLSGLPQNTTVYYQFAASNAAGWGYAPTTNSFVTLPGLGLAAKQNSLFNPTKYPALAPNLVVSGGTIAIDTGDGTNRGPSMAVNGTVYRGVVVPNQSGNVWLSLFTFGSLTVGDSVSCTVTGNLGLVLASQGDMTIGNTISLIGQPGTVGGCWGGPGAEAGVAGVSFASAPPTANHGRGGVEGNDASGFGAGTYVDNANASSGGYGGVGGTGGSAIGGTNYGDSALNDLYGGSGGGGPWPTYCGGGGGALELIANGTLTITATATQNVNGGSGLLDTRGAGSGSGGGILLAAQRLNVAGAILARGAVATSCGNGSPVGGGGGGRIAFYANTLTTNGMTVSVSGGSGSGGGTSGADGTFRYPGDGQGGDLSFPYGVRGTVVCFY